MKSAARPFSERLPMLMFVFGLAFASLIYGMVAASKKWFPYHQIVDAVFALTIFVPENKGFMWFFSETEQQKAVTLADEANMAPGLTKMVTVDGDFSLAVRVIDAQGQAFQHWRIEWFEIWPEAPSFLNPREIPKRRPGTHIHGAEILSNGDLVFNFEHLGLVRMNTCNQVVWRLPYRTHHSVFVDDDENLWVSAQINHATPDPKLPFYTPPFIEPVILKVSPAGEILVQKSVFELLLENNLAGALYTTSTHNGEPIIEGDTIFIGDSLHLNDVEVFSRTMTPGLFAPGDIMISLRNINAVMVFDANWKLKYQTSNEFVRQHDPDFLDGNRISIFDNHNTATLEQGAQSRILIKSADSGQVEIPFTGTPDQPFFTNIMGKHQWLPNGNLLLSESRYGRALEISPAGEKVWEYYNLVEPGWLGIIEEVERLPARFNADFFNQTRAQCQQASQSTPASQGEPS